MRDVGTEPQKDFREKWARPLSVPGHGTHLTEKETEAERESKSQTVTGGQVPGMETFFMPGKTRTIGREVLMDLRLGSCENTDSETHSQQARLAQKMSPEKQPGLGDRALHRTRYGPQLCHLELTVSSCTSPSCSSLSFPACELRKRHSGHQRQLSSPETG